MQRLIIFMKKSPTTIPAPVIPFEDDPEYHDDDGDDTFGLLENFSKMRFFAVVVFLLVKQCCGGTLELLWESSRSPLWILWDPQWVLVGSSQLIDGHNGENPTAMATRPQFMLIIN